MQYSPLFSSKLSKPQDITELQSQTISWLRFPLALLVLLIHINPQNSSIFTPINTISFSNLTMANVYSIIGRTGFYLSGIAVPFFFLTSGYFFFYKLKSWNVECYKNKISKRLKTLAVPYILWNLLTIFFVLLNKLLGVLLLHKPVTSFTDKLYELTDISGLLEYFWNYNTWDEGTFNILGWSTQMWGPILYPLWFLRDLIIVSLLAPLIYYGIKYLKHYFIIIIGAAYIVNICSIPGLSITGIFYFSAGAYLSLNQKNIVETFRPVRKVSWILAICLLFITVAFDGGLIATITKQLYCIAGIISIVILTSSFLEKGKIAVRPQLAQTSFFIYALHTMPLIRFSCLALAVAITKKSFFASQYAAGSIISYLTAPLLGSAFCLVIFLLMKRFAPRFLNLLTGDRN